MILLVEISIPCFKPPFGRHVAVACSVLCRTVVASGTSQFALNSLDTDAFRWLGVATSTFEQSDARQMASGLQ